MSRSIVVIGGGLAGLVAARHLADGGADVTVYESRASVGGRVRSRPEHGYTLDRGFQVLFTGYPAVQRELDLDALDLRRFKPGAVIARPGRRSTLADPLGNPAAALDSLRNPEVTFTDKLRTLALRQHLGTRTYSELFTGSDTTIRSYLRDWGFSEQYLSNFVAPFYGGITLDRSLGTSKRVFEYTFKALSDGDSAIPAEGMGAITRQLADTARDAGATIETGEAVRELIQKRRHAVVDTDSDRRAVDAVVVATNPRTAARLTENDAIPTDGVGCVTQHYRLPDANPLDTGKRILLNAGGDEPNTVVPMSEVAPEYAPDDGLLLNATFLGDAVLDTDSETLANRTKAALESWYPRRNFAGLEPLATDRIPFAQFAQPPGVHESLPSVRDGGRRTYLAGEYTEWSSIQGAMESGRKAAEAVLEDY
ncbi:FAD-dependent oxidoreductase [Halonotius terrestris]|uniref:FAD-dependent oxidoreductase n=1 Tax=Halonotius terrestris TaxID=2487750 RepID=A0A8J8PAL9_9EURY|nr:NAD(P)/FAD-dependent oxidoreductase [Halonotius terrestris]TQQ82855.1 FAD-dependent oxidoreductase [Halonotius terrestris]